ncbi:MAG: YceI family protein [Acidimicrobiia bacterium]|nr:YceI family protein [Acidimicrobiia bacterium]
MTRLRRPPSPDRTAESTTETSADDSAPDSTTTSATTPAGEADGEWVVTPGAQVWVGYRAQEEIGPTALHQEAVGRTPAVSGTLTITGSIIESVEVTADMTKLESDKDRRDDRMRSDGIETDAFPEATFALTEPIDLGSVPAVGEAVTVSATGDLTIHGATSSVTMELEARWNGDTIDVAGSTPILFDDYGIENPSVAGLISVEDAAVMELQLTFARA